MQRMAVAVSLALAMGSCGIEAAWAAPPQAGAVRRVVRKRPIAPAAVPLVTNIGNDTYVYRRSLNLIGQGDRHYWIRLELMHNQRTTSKVYVSAARFGYTMPGDSKLKYLWVQGADFRAADDGRPVMNSQADACWLGGSVIMQVTDQPTGPAASPPPLVAPLHVPDGATLRNMRVSIHDASPNARVKLQLSRFVYQNSGAHGQAETLVEIVSP